LLCSTHKGAKSLQQNPTQNSSHHWDLQVEMICYNNNKTIRKKNPVSFLLHESKREVTQQQKRTHHPIWVAAAAIMSWAFTSGY